mmetsp:Transcript_10064/g.30737  ORF Transcript_10064/g.30737 Transcript_10064/m.30737 type:complete len:360 (-) Transcript_10064:895-1974(-)|eukprot:CAMPEP_0198737022 /NCGR_PEP_ID=MMETSP1475-20131203/67654_1 /TAXON_ID= ORGANISM="Unidentified sp., Strain CCMP1999" /NCGR_SAMPLE_ID=MMETSP1475 /ASSEMBLY_ACC=CAM_ASM_001111 /LENGTH=359 /DNA_ID=CAMNT_0044500877 /DNA_START=27 /DNA_END=1106 /DNA_ORIENTATION=-
MTLGYVVGGAVGVRGSWANGVATNGRRGLRHTCSGGRRVTVRAEADKTSAVDKTSDELAPPPSTFYQAVTQAQDAAEEALKAGQRLIEVEFPPLPQDQLDSSAVGAYAVIDANLKLVVDFAKRFADQGKRVSLALPDAAEKDRALELCNEQEEPYPNIRLGSLTDSYKGTFLDRLLTTGVEKDIAVRDDDDMYIVLGASCQELPDVERLAEKAGKKPIVFFNLKLDTARGDLGLPAFPPKSLHFRFLCRIVPVYYLRTRTYSRSVPQPPYVVNYSGALYRVFPGKYQVLLNTTNGKYKRVDTFDERPSLGEVRDVLTKAMNIPVRETPAPLLDFLRKGVKSTTWWEEDYEKQESNNWRK